MKKMLPLMMACVILFGFYGILTYRNHFLLEKNIKEMMYMNNDERNNSNYAMKIVLRESNLAVFGSSELFAYDIPAHPKNLFLEGNSNFNMTLIGRDYFQSLLQAISIGALQKSLPGNRAILILSPQWFTREHYNSEMFSSRFSERQYVEMISNPEISYAVKRYITDRAKSYLKDGDPEQYKRLTIYDKLYIEKQFNLFNWVYTKIWNSIMEMRADWILLEQLSKSDEDSCSVEAYDICTIDFHQLLKEANERGEELCTNNSIYINDTYYTQWIEKNFYKSQNTNGTVSYTDSPEYDDLKWLIKLCKDCNISLMLTSIPLNGAWCDWIGLPYENRFAYYQKIRDLCSEEGIQLLDFSDKEDEAYFLKDVMHMGWKAWVYFDEASIRFSQKNNEMNTYPFPIEAYNFYDGSDRKLLIASHLSDVKHVDVISGDKKYELKQNRRGFWESEQITLDFENAGAVVKIEGEIGGSYQVATEFVDNDMCFINSSYSAGFKINDDRFLFSTLQDDAWFDRVLFQIYNPETGACVARFGNSDKEGPVIGEYKSNLPSGEYNLVFKANSNIKDELMSCKVFLAKGEKIYYQYTINKIFPTRIEVSNFEVWHSIAK